MVAHALNPAPGGKREDSQGYTRETLPQRNKANKQKKKKKFKQAPTQLGVREGFLQI